MADKPLAIQAFAPRLLKLLGHERRYAIFLRLGDRPWTCEELAEDLDEDIKRIYEDVGALAREGAVELIGKEASPRGSPDIGDVDGRPATPSTPMNGRFCRLLKRER